jgi:hypothetical protein
MFTPISDADEAAIITQKRPLCCSQRNPTGDDGHPALKYEMNDDCLLNRFKLDNDGT